MYKKSIVIGFVLSFLLILVVSIGAAAEPQVSTLASGLENSMGAGSAIGPDGALYVTEALAGRISRVDPQTGDVTTFASGLPAGNPAIGVGGVMDVAFIDGTAYALTAIVGPGVGGNPSDVAGIYRVDGPSSFTCIADLGTWSMNNPPETDYFVAIGLQYALEPFRGGLLVTDGHHNRVLYVTLGGDCGDEDNVSEMIAFGNVVPTGLEVHGNTVLMTEAGPIPHYPADGKVMAFGPKSDGATEIASGAPLLVDVEYGLGQTLYALSQGTHNDSTQEGSPADEGTGALVKVNTDGTMTFLVEELDRPTSFEFIGNTAYVVTIPGDVLKIENVGNPPFGVPK